MVYAEVETRGARSPAGAPAATAFPIGKVIALSDPPRYACGSVDVDKLVAEPEGGVSVARHN
jgi:hypothetical protein